MGHRSFWFIQELIMNGAQKLLVHTETDNEWGTEASGSYRRRSLLGENVDEINTEAFSLDSERACLEVNAGKTKQACVFTSRLICGHIHKKKGPNDSHKVW
jgi:hypothetical protein